MVFLTEEGRHVFNTFAKENFRSAVADVGISSKSQQILQISDFRCLPPAVSLF